MGDTPCRARESESKVEVARLDLDTGQTKRDGAHVEFRIIASLIFSEAIYHSDRWGTFEFGVRKAIFRLIPRKCKLIQRNMGYIRKQDPSVEIEIENKNKREDRASGEATAKIGIIATVKEFMPELRASAGGSRNASTESSASSSQTRKIMEYLVRYKGTKSTGEAEWLITSLSEDRILRDDVFLETENNIGKATEGEAGWTLQPEIELIPGCEVLLNKDIPNPSRKDQFDQAWKAKAKLAAILVGKDVFEHVPLVALRDTP